MGIRESFYHLFRGGRPVKVDTSFLPALESANLSDIINLLVSIRETGSRHADEMRDYQRMVEDGVCGGAVNLLADEATQVDATSKKDLWVEPVDDTVASIEAAQYLSSFIEENHIDRLLWPVAYAVIRDGGCYLTTHYTELTDMGLDKKGRALRNKLGYLFDIEDDYSRIAELQFFGDVVGFYKETPKKSVVYPKKDFIHFINDRRGESEKVKLKLPGLDSDSQEKENEFTIRRGLSFLRSARSAFRILEVMELVLVAVRLGRSQLYRLVQVEVGNADKNETVKLLREFKTKLATQESLDTVNGSYTASLKPVPHGQNVYIPTRNGKGAVDIKTVGGDYDIREILDIDYFKNKLYAALQVPKAYLGFEESLPGGIGDTSLTRLDIRFARKVRRLKEILEQGFQDLCNFHLDIVGKADWKNKFAVRTSQIVTAEENDKYESFKGKSEFVDALGTLLADVPGFSKRKFARVAMVDLLGMPEIYDKCVDETVTDQGGDGYEPMGVSADNEPSGSPPGDGKEPSGSGMMGGLSEPIGDQVEPEVPEEPSSSDTSQEDRGL